MSTFGRRFLLLTIVWIVVLAWMRRLAIANLEKDAWTGYAVLDPGQQYAADTMTNIATLTALFVLIIAPPVLAAWLWQRRDTG